mmetsp:Transcript_100725/g.291166  ORF Transcript_100725/g.291166 Transcript_100725/m.291166 type:complete len:340 (+) Transcript_100725:556-1575(+)
MLCVLAPEPPTHPMATSSTPGQLRCCPPAETAVGGPSFRRHPRTRRLFRRTARRNGRRQWRRSGGAGRPPCRAARRASLRDCRRGTMSAPRVDGRRQRVPAYRQPRRFSWPLSTKEMQRPHGPLLNCLCWARSQAKHQPLALQGGGLLCGAFSWDARPRPSALPPTPMRRATPPAMSQRRCRAATQKLQPTHSPNRRRRPRRARPQRPGPAAPMTRSPRCPAAALVPLLDLGCFARPGGCPNTSSCGCLRSGRCDSTLRCGPTTARAPPVPAKLLPPEWPVQRRRPRPRRKRPKRGRASPVRRRRPRRPCAPARPCSARRRRPRRRRRRAAPKRRRRRR